MIKMAETMKFTGKGAAAVALAAKWNKDHPTDMIGTMYYSEQLMATKQFAPAATLLEEVIKREPNSAAALNNLAWVYQQQKDGRALATAQKAMKLTVDNAAVIDTVGWLMTEQGDVKGGLPLLQKAAGLAPNALEIRYHLAVALSKSGDKAGARKELDAVLSQNKHFAQIDEARALLKTL